MISARLHDYVVKAILDKLVRADAENVRFWQKADRLTEHEVRYERKADQASFAYELNNSVREIKSMYFI